MLTLLQVCNVGQIVGGTAACAWTVTRAFPEFRHEVAFLGKASSDTVRQFAPAMVREWDRVTRKIVSQMGADLVLLHNTSAGRTETPLPVPSLNYLHSQIRPAPADLTLSCSDWLARKMKLPPQQVCHQAVPQPPRPDAWHDTRALRTDLVVGRICTPQRAKWPNDLPGFYAPLAVAFPTIRWEFVGCPHSLQPELQSACDGRAEFLPASWEARSRLWTWDALLYHNPQLTESFGRTVTEALRCGCVPIVDCQGGFVEQLPAQTGFLCESPSDFRNALAALQNPGTRRRHSRACQEHGNTQFSLARFRKDLLTHFQQTLKAVG